MRAVETEQKDTAEQGRLEHERANHLASQKARGLGRAGS
jgi:hypothetical protein